MIDESGGVVKRCISCGRRLLLQDWYAAMATKYCPECAANQTRLNKANYMREARRKARERRKLEREQTRLTMQENDLLRQALREQAARIEALEGKWGK